VAAATERLLRIQRWSAAVALLAAITKGTGNSTIRVPNVVIDEVMYNSPWGQDYEFVEFRNLTGSPVNIENWKVSGLGTFQFPAGASIPANSYVIAARNVAALEAAFGASVVRSQAPSQNAFQWPTSSGLDKNGERIVLLNSTAEIIDEVTYSPSWAPRSNLGGSSLELIDPRSDNRLGENWSASDESQKATWVTCEIANGIRDHEFPHNTGYGAYTGHNTYAYKPVGEGWKLVPWDPDHVLGMPFFNANAWGDDVFLYTDASEPTISQLQGTPEFQRAYWRGLKKGVDGPLSSSKLNSAMDNRFNALIANSVVASSSGLAARKAWGANRRSSVSTQVSAADAASLEITSNNGQNFTTTQVSYSLAGITWRTGVSKGAQNIETKTDQDGKFAFQGYHGASVAITIEKSDHLYCATNTFFQYSDFIPKESRHHPNPSKPVIFHLWKRQGAEELLRIDQTYRFSPAATPVFVDLLSHCLVSSGGDLKVTISRGSGAALGRSPISWDLFLEAVDGGLIPTEIRMLHGIFSAPEDGYMPTFEFNMDSDNHFWTFLFKEGFLLKSRGGERFSKLKIGFTLNVYENEPAWLTLEGVANPNGSRNWEEDPSKIKNSFVR
jgi:hypothetical protein